MRFLNFIHSFIGKVEKEMSYNGYSDFEIRISKKKKRKHVIPKRNIGLFQVLVENDCWLGCSVNMIWICHSIQ